MKKLFFITLPFCAASLHAQQPPSFEVIDTTDKFRQLLDFQRKMIQQGKFSHSTSRGTVYILPYDNMPCLVPNMQTVARMPGAVHPQPESRMPNAMPERPMIPRKKDEE